MFFGGILKSVFSGLPRLLGPHASGLAHSGVQCILGIYIFGGY